MKTISRERQVTAMEQNFENNQPNPPRRRRKRSKWQDFKEAYLPVIILAAALLMIVIFIIGALNRSDAPDPSEPDVPGTSESQNEAALQSAKELMAKAEAYAQIYDYVSAMDTLMTFTGDMTTIEGMVELYNSYGAAHSMLIPFSKMDRVPVISFNTLIGDIKAAEADPERANSYMRNYVTSSEFSAILQELYDNGYVLVRMHDIATKKTGSDDSYTLSTGKLLLPQGKKPIILILSGADYSAYNAGAGFPTKLVLDANGQLTNELTAADGTVTTGNYDLIPILSAFLKEHPDFSYHGARATIAVSGSGSLFGYPLSDGALSPVISAIKAEGYDFACYTYETVEYGNMKVAAIQEDLAQWVQNVEPIVGDTDILVYPYGNDFSEEKEYTGEKFDAMIGSGFCYFVQTETSTPYWSQIKSDYMRISRRWITGTNLSYRQTYLKDLFDPNKVLDPNRSEVPQQ